jgi:hypothetical protein
LAQGCFWLRAVFSSGLFLAQGCFLLRAVFGSGLFLAQGCFSLARQVGGEVHNMENTTLLLGT